MIEVSIVNLPKGTRCIKLVSTGRTEGKDAEEIMLKLQPGGSFHGLPMLVVTDETTTVSADARRIFTAQTNPATQGNEQWTAIVTKIMVMRVTLNFINRVNKSSRLRMFATPEEATDWLETQTIADASVSAPKS